MDFSCYITNFVASFSKIIQSFLDMLSSSLRIVLSFDNFNNSHASSGAYITCATLIITTIFLNNGTSLGEFIKEQKTDLYLWHISYYMMTICYNSIDYIIKQTNSFENVKTFLVILLPIGHLINKFIACKRVYLLLYFNNG